MDASAAGSKGPVIGWSCVLGKLVPCKMGMQKGMGAPAGDLMEADGTGTAGPQPALGAELYGQC